jgi:hypothetical protein
MEMNPYGPLHEGSPISHSFHYLLIISKCYLKFNQFLKRHEFGYCLESRGEAEADQKGWKVDGVKVVQGGSKETKNVELNEKV